MSARKAASKSPTRDPRLPAAGAVLERTVKGKMVRVTVLETGFRWNGKTYRSLSAIATKAYGCPANGFLVFGLVGRPAATRPASAPMHKTPKKKRSAAKEIP
jgi:hypothetical protein